MATETRTLRVLNTTACPTTDPTPDPEFAGVRICTDAEPRHYAGTQSRKQDVNPSSPTYLQWLKADLTYTPVESLGDYFVTGETDTTLCPLVDNLVPASLSVTTGQISFKIVRDYEPLPPNDGGATVSWELIKIVGGTVLASDSITIIGSLLESSIQTTGISGVSSGDSVRLHFISVTPNYYNFPTNTTTSVA